jgi:hypothetical protein
MPEVLPLSNTNQKKTEETSSIKETQESYLVPASIIRLTEGNSSLSPKHSV